MDLGRLLVRSSLLNPISGVLPDGSIKAYSVCTCLLQVPVKFSAAVAAAAVAEVAVTATAVAAVTVAASAVAAAGVAGVAVGL
jgi:hypothetical protein